MEICTQEDDYILEKFDGQTRWVVQLSDGTRVFQDDDRPGMSANSAWIRLGKYIKESKLSIDYMKLQFRSHIIHVNNGPKDKVDGFFFCKSALGSPGMEKTQEFYVAGTLRNGILETKRWMVPELELDVDGVQIRKVADAGEFLILNYGQEI